MHALQPVASTNRAREVALERRCQELLEECQRRQDRTSAATSELESATARLRSQDQQLGALAGTREGLEAQLRQARADAKKQVGGAAQALLGKPSVHVAQLAGLEWNTCHSPRLHSGLLSRLRATFATAQNLPGTTLLFFVAVWPHRAG
jgi:hypothetical protein